MKKKIGKLEMSAHNTGGILDCINNVCLRDETKVTVLESQSSLTPWHTNRISSTKS